MKVDDNNIVLQMALAGISKEDLSLKVKGNCFTVSYSKTDSDQQEHRWRGISARNFSKTFTLREDWEVSKASLDNGLLEVAIAYSIPEDEQEVAIEVIKASAHYLSDRYGVKTIILGVNQNNHAAKSVYKKIGFTIKDQNKNNIEMIWQL